MVYQRTSLTPRQARGKMMNGAPNPIDVFVGKRIRLRRKILQMSQTDLAQLLSITFQQLQKYEKGINRISASHLWDMSVVLKVPVAFFYEGIDYELDQYSPRRLYRSNIPPVMLEPSIDPLTHNSNLELITALEKIKNHKLQQDIRNLIISISRLFVDPIDDSHLS